ncbi:hypothetical protein A1O7_05187 [Cladophialophora yegresii CBS 114405]|uniref:aldehyde dehydrogenase (NAD(+)) n=1 Tax=Cladophialophora yegresii CBS 114405 TaxID=1182544 RepID=W9WRQ3_9EURO|nr:uncharacterized protein A1O7_05187 [Cladophialophora yegresii CBS 114405]EXJ61034.1 hypothetical protein A1O7_05187 [Cladophialophora yegresii CBS 114405]
MVSDFETRLFIDGEFRLPHSGKQFDLFNPATSKQIGSVYEAGVEDVDDAVESASQAFETWSETPASERGQWLHRLADKLSENVEEMSRLEALTMGRPMHNDFTIPWAIEILRYFANRASDIQGETSLSDPSLFGMTVRQPFGVTAAIIPWNTPILMLSMKIGPALAAGNTMVLKTSEKSPLSCLVVARCMKEIGFPRGVLSILSGFGRPCGEALAKHMDIRKLAFTGSTATGKAIKKAAAESNLKNVTLELGGKSPLIIFEDADLAKAAVDAANSIMVVSGQSCMASSRVYVEDSRALDFIELVKKEITKIGVSGDPLAKGTLRGPQADHLQYERILSFLDVARQEKLNVVLGGDKENKAGYYIQPTVIFEAPDNSRLIKEEIFGPVLCVSTFTDEADVLRRANDTEYGLYASVYTRDIVRALRVAKKLQAGSVGINVTSPTTSLDLPFGGWKESGEGRELGKHALDSWTELKTILIGLPGDLKGAR